MRRRWLIIGAPIALNPGNADTCNNIGAALQFLSRDEEALPWFDRALALQPGFVLAILNKAASQLQRVGSPRRSDLSTCQGTRPRQCRTRVEYSLLYMLTGDFEVGWAMREARWKKANPASIPNSPSPRWFGEGNIEGKTIVICADEGLGDTIQFVRYVPMVASLGARVILVVDPPAHALLSGTPGIAQCLRKDLGVSVPFDLHCPMSGLPLAFGTQLDTIPPGEAYLPPCP